MTSHAGGSQGSRVTFTLQISQTVKSFRLRSNLSVCRVADRQIVIRFRAIHRRLDGLHAHFGAAQKDRARKQRRPS
eukprot:3328982-Rhodomonas_salina.1